MRLYDAHSCKKCSTLDVCFAACALQVDPSPLPLLQ
jgi:radical SAM protein with 4Fe4S-binding SPASM domain